MGGWKDDLRRLGSLFLHWEWVGGCSRWRSGEGRLGKRVLLLKAGLDGMGMECLCSVDRNRTMYEHIET